MIVTKDQVKTYSISRLAMIISMDWKNVSVHALPYLETLLYIESINDKYGEESSASIVSYFLSNARGYRGETAKIVKAELSRRLKETYKHK
jgi:hypothetical protein